METSNYFSRYLRRGLIRGPWGGDVDGRKGEERNRRWGFGSMALYVEYRNGAGSLWGLGPPEMGFSGKPRAFLPVSRVRMDGIPPPLTFASPFLSLWYIPSSILTLLIDHPLFPFLSHLCHPLLQSRPFFPPPQPQTFPLAPQQQIQGAGSGAGGGAGGGAGSGSSTTSTASPASAAAAALAASASARAFRVVTYRMRACAQRATRIR